MSVLKGILVYALIFIGLVIGVGVILVGIMYFFPSVSIFGYKFYHGNDAGTICEVVSSATETGKNGNIRYIDKNITDNLDAIEVIADNYNIEIAIFKGVAGSAQSFRVEFTKSLTGFIDKNTSGPWFSVEAKKKVLTGESEEKNVVTFVAHEPDGFYMNRNAHITIWIADNVAGGNLGDLRIESGRGHVGFKQGFISELDKSGNPVLNVDTLAIYDKANTVNLKYVNIKNTLKIEADSSNFTIEDDLSCDVLLNCKKGKFKFANVNSVGTSPVVRVDAVNADVQFADIDANVSLTTDYGLFRATSITGNFSSLGHNITDSNNACDLAIGKIEGTVIIQNASGKIQIEQVGQVASLTTVTDLRIDTKSGNVTINNCFAKKAEITSTRGAIKLGNALCGVNAKTTYGSVTIDYMKEDAVVEGVSSELVSSAVQMLKNYEVNISTGVDKGDGSIDVRNVRGQATLKSGGSGKIYAEFSDVTGVNTIESSRGSVDVIVPQIVHTEVAGGTCTGFWLSWKAKTADIYIVNYSSIKETSVIADKYNKTQDAVYVGGEAEDEDNPTKMIVKANNKARIYDTGHNVA